MQVEVGAVLEGKVTGLTNFGAFVSFEGGKTGMVHISEVASTYVKDIHDYLKEGQDVKVKVLNVGEDGKISLSIRRAEENSQPREERRVGPRGDRRRAGGPSKPNVWQGTKQRQPQENMSFEDMMSRFKQISDDKMTDLKRSTEVKHGGFSRRGGGPRG